MKTFKIYLAGGMQNLSFEEQNEWREHVRKELEQEYYNGNIKYHLDIINPCRYYNFNECRYDSLTEVMRFDLHHVKTSDLMLVNFNDPQSIGTAMEIATCYEKGIPVIGFCDKEKCLHNWLMCASEKILDTEEDAIKYVVDFYLS